MSAIEDGYSLVDVGFTVRTALDAAGVIAVMTGGSAATFYSASYQSLDLDFVIQFVAAHANPERVIEALGFHLDGRPYAHAKTPYTLDSPPRPLAIGREFVTSYSTEKRGPQILNVLSRSDSVRDRLAAFYHRNDRSSLESALLVAASGQVDLGRIESWSADEGAKDRYDEFAARLKRDARHRDGR